MVGLHTAAVKEAGLPSIWITRSIEVRSLRLESPAVLVLVVSLSGAVARSVGAAMQQATAYVESPPSPMSATKSSHMDSLSARCSKVKPSPS